MELARSGDGRGERVLALYSSTRRTRRAASEGLWVQRCTSWHAPVLAHPEQEGGGLASPSSTDPERLVVHVEPNRSRCGDGSSRSSSLQQVLHCGHADRGSEAALIASNYGEGLESQRLRSEMFESESLCGCYKEAHCSCRGLVTSGRVQEQLNRELVQP